MRKVHYVMGIIEHKKAKDSSLNIIFRYNIYFIYIMK